MSGPTPGPRASADGTTTAGPSEEEEGQTIAHKCRASVDWACIAHALSHRGWMLATAESCTGGLIAGACTDLAGSSQWFERGFVTYSNAAKTELLGVPAALIEAHGAVSEPVVRAMAEGAVRRSRAQVSIAVTGVAGPSGGSAEKPVGTVWFGWHVDGVTHSEALRLPGGRAAVRAATVQHAVGRLAEWLKQEQAIPAARGD